MIECIQIFHNFMQKRLLLVLLLHFAQLFVAKSLIMRGKNVSLAQQDFDATAQAKHLLCHFLW